MHLELISFKLCPFVQRSVITLLHKKAPFDISYIDLSEPPAWFFKISPFRRVPVLRVDDKTVLFESAIINEFIDDVTAGSLMPADPLQKAQNRGWIQFGEQCLVDQYHLSTAENGKSWEESLAKAHHNLAKIEGMLGEGPYFNGESFSLVDAAFAPLFMRYALWPRTLGALPSEEFPRLVSWSKTLLGLPEVQQSVVDDFHLLYAEHIREHGGYLANAFPVNSR